MTLAQLLIDFLKTQLVAPNAPNAKDAQDGMNAMALRKLDMGAPQMVAAAAGGARAPRAPHPHHG